MTELDKKAVWLKGLISNFFGDISEPIIHCDSHSALALSKNFLYHDQTKHVMLNFTI